MQRFAVILALPFVVVATGASAQLKILETGTIWSAYSLPNKGGPTCYLVGKPDKSTPPTAQRSRVDAMVSHRVAEKAYNVVTFNLGYAVKKDAKAELTIDGKKYGLFVDNDAAWTPNAATDKAVTEALARGSTATIKAVSAHGTATTDTYDLTGFGKALKAIDATCKVKR
ncbi:MAG: hypothetical protein KGL11_13575 [Alphaproteobacteria bacterium]|nr:hypothetical protein [Alphaproteobacteria bacterium]